jgi:hypothetical protein
MSRVLPREERRATPLRLNWWLGEHGRKSCESTVPGVRRTESCSECLGSREDEARPGGM